MRCSLVPASDGCELQLVWYEGASTSDKRFLHANHQGSIVAVTDSAGAVVGTNAYGPYGIPAQTHLGRFLYTGQAFIPEVGLYHYKARAYSPTLGRFLQTDPVGYDDQMNLYAYVGNDPVNASDPTGRWTCGQNSADQCKAVSDALKEARRALKNMTGKEARALRAVLAAYGREGVDNGVMVEAADIGSVAQTSTKDGLTTVSINAQINSFEELRAASIGSAAGTIAHEGGHIVDERGVLGGRDPKTKQERYDTERRAYTLQGAVDRALGVASRGAFPLWLPTWGKSQEQKLMEEGARGNAWRNACRTRSNCPGINAW